MLVQRIPIYPGKYTILYLALHVSKDICIKKGSGKYGQERITEKIKFFQYHTIHLKFLIAQKSISSTF